MDENILSRILNGEATPDEKNQFYQSLAQNEQEQEIFYQVKSLWLRTSVYKTTTDVNSEFDELWTKIRKDSHRSQSLYHRLVQYAAIIIFLIGIGSLIGYYLAYDPARNLSEIQHYSSMKGSVSMVEFGDGTKVWLNSDSKMNYRFDKKGKKRLAELSGEAYFEVAHSDDFPFLVKTGKITIRDLGTTFNVKAYPDDQYIETSLIEGRVDILNEKHKSMLELKPGEKATYYPEQSKIETGTLELNVLSAWREGKFIVRDQKLSDIFKEISRWYDVRFKFERESLQDLRFTGNIKKSTSLQNILNMLKLTADFNYRIVEDSEKTDIVVIY